METTETLDGCRTDALDGVGIPDVDGDGVHLRALLGEPRRMRSDALLVDVGHDDAQTLAHEGFDDGEANSAGRSGDDRRPPLQMLHRAIVPALQERQMPCTPASAKMVAVMERCG